MTSARLLAALGLLAGLTSVPACSDDAAPAEPSETPSETPAGSSARIDERDPDSELILGTDGQAHEASEFLRCVTPEDGETRLETAVCVYEDADGRRVDLIGAIHIGDQDYFDTLDVLFQGYDALLYEMVKDPEASPVRRPGEQESMISLAQRLMKDTLALEFQLDAVDYSAPNFVHADLDPRSFLRMQEEKGESIFTLLLNSALTQMAQEQADPEQSMVQQLSLVLALLSADRATNLKRVLARQFVQLEALAAGIGGEDGSVLLEGRNERCFEVLDEQLEAGHDKLGIFYGAAHLPDMEERLIARGFQRTRRTWVTAWDVPAPEPTQD